MLLSELIERKKNFKLQISELKDYLKFEDSISNMNKIINSIFELEDKVQKYKMILDKANEQNEVEVGTNKIPVSTAIRLREATKRKMDTITTLIEDTKVKIDILDLMKQRSALLEEYLIYDKAISINDWRTNVD
jgi:uncharacterized protein (DUF342 family)